jgi:hypothetical protein
MQRFDKFKLKASLILGGVATGLLLVGVACGTTAPAEPATAPDVTPAPVAEATPAVASVAEPTPMAEPPDGIKPAGTLNVGQAE